MVDYNNGNYDNVFEAQCISTTMYYITREGHFQHQSFLGQKTILRKAFRKLSDINAYRKGFTQELI